MYPNDIHQLSPKIVERFMIEGQLSFSVFNPERHFSSRNQYDFCVREQVSWLLDIYPYSYLRFLLPLPPTASGFVFDIRKELGVDVLLEEAADGSTSSVLSSAFPTAMSFLQVTCRLLVY